MARPRADPGPPQASPPPTRWQRLRPWLLGLFLCGVGFLIVRQARDMPWAEAWQSFRRYPVTTLAQCTAFGLASLGLYSCFDLVGRRSTGHRLPWWTVLRITFISYVFNLNLGSLIGGIAFRYRLYARLGLNYGQVTHILVLSMLTNWLGYLVLAGALFVLHPLAVPARWPIDTQGLRWAGAGMLAAAGAYLLVCAFSPKRQWQWRGHVLQLPSGAMALVQAGMGMGNWLLMAGLLALLMPAGIDFASVASVLLLAAIAGVLTHVPANVGVLEAVFLDLFASQAPRHELLAALLAYRLIYYLGPLLAGVLLYAGTEVWDTRRQKIGESRGMDQPDC